MVSHRLQHDVAEEVVADDAAVGHAQAQPGQAAGRDGGGATDRQADGAHQLLDLPELRRGVAVDDEDVRVDVADDVDVGLAVGGVAVRGLSVLGAVAVAAAAARRVRRLSRPCVGLAHPG